MRPHVIYAGSFDPITYGHLDIIRRARHLFGPLRVLIMTNGNKQGFFSVAQRISFIEQAVAQIPDVSVDSAEGLLADYARLQKIPLLVRGVRGPGDMETELAQAHYNKLFNPGLETVFLPTAEKFQFLSSSAVREIARCGGDITPFVPEAAAAALREKFASESSL